MKMFTKKNLWFMTLFSIILVMAVYYISTPVVDETFVGKDDSTVTKVEETSNSAINALRVSRDESLANEVSGIKEMLTSTTLTIEEKSEAYEALKRLNTNKGKEEALEALIKKDFNYESFVKIDGLNVVVTIEAKNHSYDLANKIMKSVQEQFDKKVYITVSFKK